MRPIRWDLFLRNCKQNRPAGCYAFCGPETFLKKQALVAAKRALAGGQGEAEANRRYATDTYRAGETNAREIATVVSQTGLFGGDRLVLIEDMGRLSRSGKRDQETWMRLVQTGPANPVVFMSELSAKELAGRSRFLARLLQEVQVVEFWRLRPSDAKQWIARTATDRGLRLTPQVAAYMIAHLGTDLHLLSVELEKIALMHGEGQLGLPELRQMIQGGILGSSWECVDAIVRGELREALDRLQGVRREESAFSFLWKLGHATGNALRETGGRPQGEWGRAQSRGVRGGGSGTQSVSSKHALAELLRGCYEWESRMKAGYWSSRHDYVALEGLISAHALNMQRRAG